MSQKPLELSDEYTADINIIKVLVDLTVIVRVTINIACRTFLPKEGPVGSLRKGTML